MMFDTQDVTAVAANRLPHSGIPTTVREQVETQLASAMMDAGVAKDVERWTEYFISGGRRPAPTKRTARANAAWIIQDVVCSVYNAYYDIFDINDPADFAKLERITRPLPAGVLSQA